MIRGCLREQQGKLRDEDAAALKDMCMKVFFFFFLQRDTRSIGVEYNLPCAAKRFLGTFGDFWELLGTKFRNAGDHFCLQGRFPRFFLYFSFFLCVLFCFKDFFLNN